MPQLEPTSPSPIGSCVIQKGGGLNGKGQKGHPGNPPPSFPDDLLFMGPFLYVHTLSSILTIILAIGKKQNKLLSNLFKHLEELKQCKLLNTSPDIILRRLVVELVERLFEHSHKATPQVCTDQQIQNSHSLHFNHFLCQFDI